MEKTLALDFGCRWLDDKLRLILQPLPASKVADEKEFF